MFDFEKLEVYQKAKAFNREVLVLMKNPKTLDTVTKNQLRRASLSVVLNIAEGTSRFSKADKRNFYVISRGSAFECVAIFDLLKDQTLLSNTEFDNLYAKAEELSRILFKMIRNLSSNWIYTCEAKNEKSSMRHEVDLMLLSAEIRPILDLKSSFPPAHSHPNPHLVGSVSVSFGCVNLISKNFFSFVVVFYTLQV